MTRNEELNGLKSMFETLASIPEEKRFDFFLNNSPTFRKDISSFIKQESTEKEVDYIDSEDVKLYQNYLALVALRNLTAMVYPNYLKRAEYSNRNWSYPLDITIQG